MLYRKSRLQALLTAFVCSLIAAPASAQAWNYPSFQPPVIVPRTYSFAIGSGGDYGTSIIAKWQEGLGEDLTVSADLGLADPGEGADARPLLGGSGGYRVVHSSLDLPIDLAVTAGAYLSFGDGITIFRFPIGATLGHRFPLERQLAITPYVHPRMSIDFATGDGESDTAFGLNFDLGGEFDFTRQLAARLSLVFGEVSEGRNEAGFAFGLAWRPPRLSQ
ncbi:MAG: hypothetical protein M3336_06325 [Chloroflexota bacterium]|nr:hypothetical protein [Chloroflexota bacterium]